MAVDFERIRKTRVPIYKLGDTRAAFMDLRVDATTLPSGLHLYNIRSDEEDWPYSVEDTVRVKHAGCLITARPLAILHPADEVYIDLDEDDPWSVEDRPMVLDDFIDGEMV